MSYRIFAAATLLTAPVIAMVAQNFVPQTASQQAVQPVLAQQPSESSGSAGTAPPPFIPAPPSDMAPSNDMATYGQPMAGAGQPALAPGQGLPDPSQPVPPDSAISPGVRFEKLPPAPDNNL